MGSGEAKKFRAQFGSAGRHGESFWKEEADNVGMKMLKGMGWSAGEGLGKEGQGKTALVKQFRKKDNAGIGGQGGTRDQAFLASQDLFNDVLSRLNGGDDSAPAGSGQSFGAGAETVSGHLAKRQMSRRFVRGQNGEKVGTAMKDTRNYGAAAMDEIFGRKRDAPAKASAEKAADDDDDDEQACEARPEQRTSSLSLTDYFAQKREAMGLSYAGASSSAAPAAPSGSSSGGGGGGGGGLGFTLDDQAAFAEEQMAKAYSGRGGLGAGGGGGGGGGGGSGWGGGGGGSGHRGSSAPSMAFAPPQAIQPTESQARLLYGGKKVDAAKKAEEDEEAARKAKKAAKKAKKAAAADAESSSAATRTSPRLAAAAAAVGAEPAPMSLDAAAGDAKDTDKAARKAAKKAAKKAAAAAQVAEAEAAAAKAAKKAAKKASKEAKPQPAAEEPRKRKAADGDDDAKPKKEKKKKTA